MNIEKLKQLEEKFLIRYPEGFNDPELKKHGKKHKVEKHIDNIKTVCTPENLRKGHRVFKDVAKIVTSSSLVSVFEKVRFRDFASDLNQSEQTEYVRGVYELIHGKQKEGFHILVDLLSTHNLAKWPIISIYRAYYFINKDVFMKPTNIKKILKHLDIDDIKYVTKPDYSFYNKYRKYINDMKKEVSKELKANNLLFGAFLMLSIS